MHSTSRHTTEGMVFRVYFDEIDSEVVEAKGPGWIEFDQDGTFVQYQARFLISESCSLNTAFLGELRKFALATRTYHY